MTLEAQMARIKGGAANRRRAYEMGLKDYFVAYPPQRVLAYNCLRKAKSLLIAIAHQIPNAAACDLLYRRLAHLLIGVAFFEGYYRREESAA
jgi:hypothetical protein